jgi:hypothetical protein
MAHPRYQGTKNPRPNRLEVVEEDAVAEALEAEEAGKAEEENVSAQIILMNTALTQMMNIWPTL